MFNGAKSIKAQSLQPTCYANKKSSITDSHTKTNLLPLKKRLPSDPTEMSYKWRVGDLIDHSSLIASGATKITGNAEAKEPGDSGYYSYFIRIEKQDDVSYWFYIQQTINRKKSDPLSADLCKKKTNFQLHREKKFVTDKVENDLHVLLAQ